jgi:hypothetical protein
MKITLVKRSLTALSVAIAMSFGLTGCVQSMEVPSSFPFASGNWQIDSSDPKAAALPGLSGSLTGTSTNVSGILHVDSVTSCLDPSVAIEVAGWANKGAVLTLTGQVAGGTLTVQGVLAADGRSMGETWYQVEGGNCALSPAQGVAQNYKAVTGKYTGSFKDASGLVSNLTVNLSQSPQADALGNYSLSGQGAFTAFPCLTNPANLTDTEVTGSNVKMTYVDPVTNDSVSVSGNLASDSQSMMVTNWTLSGGCSKDSGTGKLVQQL